MTELVVLASAEGEPIGTALGRGQDYKFRHRLRSPTQVLSLIHI